MSLLSREEETHYTFYSKEWLDQFPLTKHTVLGLFTRSVFYETPYNEPPLIAEPERVVFSTVQYTVITDTAKTLTTGEAPFYVILRSALRRGHAQPELERAYYVTGPRHLNTNIAHNNALIPAGTIFPLNDIHKILTYNLNLALQSMNVALDSLRALHDAAGTDQGRVLRLESHLQDENQVTLTLDDIAAVLSGDGDVDEDGDGDMGEMDSDIKGHATAGSDGTQNTSATQTLSSSSQQQQQQQPETPLTKEEILQQAQQRVFDEFQPFIKGFPLPPLRTHENIMESTLYHFDLNTFFS